MKPQNGDTVRLHYIGSLDGGEIFDTSKDSGSFEFIIGNGKILPLFEKAVRDIEIGEKTVIDIPVDQAYGERSEGLVISVSKNRFPPQIEAEVGMELTLETGQGPLDARVLEVNVDDVVLDANHPLAGKNLHFEIELLQILPNK